MQFAWKAIVIVISVQKLSAIYGYSSITTTTYPRVNLGLEVLQLELVIGVSANEHSLPCAVLVSFKAASSLFAGAEGIEAIGHELHLIRMA